MWRHHSLLKTVKSVLQPRLLKTVGRLMKMLTNSRTSGISRTYSCAVFLRFCVHDIYQQTVLLEGHAIYRAHEEMAAGISTHVQGPCCSPEPNERMFCSFRRVASKNVYATAVLNFINH